QCRHQEGDVPPGRERSQLALQGAADVGARLPFPHPPALPVGQSRLQAAGAAAAHGWLRARARLVVHRRRAAPQAVAATEAGPHQDDGSSRRVPPGAGGAVTAVQRPSSRIIAAPFSAIIMVGALVLPDVIVGITEASTTRSRWHPINRSRSSTTAVGSLSRPILAVPTG